MNTTFPTIGQISGDNWKTDSSPLRDGLTQTLANISGSFAVEHTADNHHATITATGPITERGRSAAMGGWINVPFDATDFTVAGAGNSWVVDAPTPGSAFNVVSYMLVGDTMFLNIDISHATMTIALGINTVHINLPTGFRIAGSHNPGSFVGRTSYGHCEIVNGGTSGPGFIGAAPGDTTVFIEKADTSFYASDAAHAGLIRGQIFFEVVAT